MKTMNRNADDDRRFHPIIARPLIVLHGVEKHTVACARGTSREDVNDGEAIDV